MDGFVVMLRVVVACTLALGACADSGRAPPGSAGHRGDSPGTDRIFAYCPKPGSGVARRAIDSGLALQTLTYVQSDQAPPCIVSFGGTQRYFDVFGATAWEARDAQRLGATLSQLFPLQAGRRARLVLTAEGERGSGSNVWAFTFEVLRRETTQVPAGRFQAYVVAMTQQGMFNNSFLEQTLIWLHEDTWLPLRVTHRLTRGYADNRHVDWEATRLVFPR
jgi:hypothetical protein